MRVLVVGSGGVGSAVVPIASRRDFFERMVFTDIDEAKAQTLVDRYGEHGRFAAARLDATDPTQIADAARNFNCDWISSPRACGATRVFWDRRPSTLSRSLIC
jgi:saccharopine dehydrogenase-like NADP-dependent oxidoreductase